MILLAAFQRAPAENWRKVTSVSDVVNAYPDRMNSLLSSLDLDRDGLGPVKQAWNNKNLKKACNKLLSYYQNANTVPSLRNPSIDGRETDVKHARQIMKDIFHGFGDKGSISTVPNFVR